MSAEATFEAQSSIVTQDGADADVSIQTQRQDAAEAETQLTAHCVAWPNAQACSDAPVSACKGATIRHHYFYPVHLGKSML